MGSGAARVGLIAIGIGFVWLIAAGPNAGLSDPATGLDEPQTSVTKGPARVTFNRRPVLRFRSDEPAARFECRIDAASFRACRSPHRIRRLADGRHRFRVRGVDSGGTADPTPALRRFGVVPRTETFGRSVRGRKLKVRRSGNPAARRTVLVVGSIHGDETAGHGIVRRIRAKAKGRPGIDLWVARTVNPDGVSASRRANARGVDLNRNFGVGWSPGPHGLEYPGPRAFSEPESRAVRRLIRHTRPRVTIWYHQPWGEVLAPCSGGARLERRYSRISRLPMKRCRGERLPGTATRWQERGIGGTAFVVELGGGSPSSSIERRHARAALAVAKPQR